MSRDYVDNPYTCAKLGINPSTGNPLANGWNKTKIINFSETPLDVRPPTDFDIRWFKRRVIAQRCAFYGYKN